MGEQTAFAGVDLAWQTEGRHTGLALLRGDEAGARLVVVGGAHSLEATVAWLAAHATASTVAAIDAPLIVRNATGHRPCDRQVARRFGARQAAPHAVNLRLYPAPGGVALARRLQDLGFAHDPAPERARHRAGRWFFEVYPHPAQVVLFGLERSLRYKRGPVAARRQGLRRLHELLRARLPAADPPLHMDERLEALLGEDLAALRGRALKRHEDRLDALFCAYLAHFHWRWGGARTAMIGDLAGGYIVNPTGPLA